MQRFVDVGSDRTRAPEPTPNAVVGRFKVDPVHLAELLHVTNVQERAKSFSRKNALEKPIDEKHDTSSDRVHLALDDLLESSGLEANAGEIRQRSTESST